jgi:tetratricopeptide (TPR) repeat protein
MDGLKVIRQKNVGLATGLGGALTQHAAKFDVSWKQSATIVDAAAERIPRSANLAETSNGLEESQQRPPESANEREIMDNDKRRLEEMLVATQKVCATYAAELDRLAVDHSETLAKFEEAGREYAKLTRERDILAADKRQAEEMLTVTQNACASHVAELDQLMLKHQDALENLMTVQQLNENLSRERDRLLVQNSEIEAKLATVRASNAMMQAEFSSEKEKFSLRNAELTARLENIQSDIIRITGEQDRLAVRHAGLETKVIAARLELDAKQGQIADLIAQRDRWYTAAILSLGTSLRTALYPDAWLTKLGLCRSCKGLRRHQQLLNSLADRERDERHWETAARLYRQFLDMDPTNFPIWIQYGHALKEAGYLEAAITAYRKGLELRPNDADALRNLAGALKISGRPAEAAEDVKLVFARS